MTVVTVILAAGQGTRMKSDLAKVLHPVGGKPMVLRAVEIAAQVSDLQPIVVVGRDADTVRAVLGDKAHCVLQAEQLGTGHAVLQATEALKDKADTVVVFYADMPLLRPETLRELIALRADDKATLSLLSVIEDDPRGFGRVVRNDGGNTVQKIVEERECTPAQKLIKELNAGVYAFEGRWLWDSLASLRPQSNGEYYLTDLVEHANVVGGSVVGLQIQDKDEVIGINTRVHLSEAEAALRRRINRGWMLDGVTIIDPATTYIHEDAVIGQDTVILPNTQIWGKTEIGIHGIIGPNTVIHDSKIGAHCAVEASTVEGATLEDHVDIGPYAHLRKGAYLCRGVHMGNFGEVKNSRLGPNTKMGHFSYIGDSEIGEDVNLGAGVITVNFDGVRKHKTVIGDHAFIGSDSMLIAPIKVDNDARTAAGSVVTKNVPEGHIAIGVPARMRKITPLNSASE